MDTDVFIYKDFDEKIQKCEEEIIDIQRQIDDRIKQNKK